MTIPNLSSWTRPLTLAGILYGCGEPTSIPNPSGCTTSRCSEQPPPASRDCNTSNEVSYVGGEINLTLPGLPSVLANVTPTPRMGALNRLGQLGVMALPCQEGASISDIDALPDGRVIGICTYLDQTTRMSYSRIFTFSVPPPRSMVTVTSQDLPMTINQLTPLPNDQILASGVTEFLVFNRELQLLRRHPYLTTSTVRPRDPLTQTSAGTPVTSFRPTVPYGVATQNGRYFVAMRSDDRFGIYDPGTVLSYDTFDEQEGVDRTHGYGPSSLTSFVVGATYFVSAVSTGALNNGRPMTPSFLDILSTQRSSPIRNSHIPLGRVAAGRWSGEIAVARDGTHYIPVQDRFNDVLRLRFLAEGGNGARAEVRSINLDRNDMVYEGRVVDSPDGGLTVIGGYRSAPCVNRSSNAITSVALRPTDDAYLLVANVTSGKIYLVDTNTREVVDKYQLDLNPYDHVNNTRVGQVFWIGERRFATMAHRVYEFY